MTMMPIGVPMLAYKMPGSPGGEWVDTHQRLTRERIMSRWGSRDCAACGYELSRSEFSNNQWSKGVGTSRCRECVSEGITCDSDDDDDDDRLRDMSKYWRLTRHSIVFTRAGIHVSSKLLKDTSKCTRNLCLLVNSYSRPVIPSDDTAVFLVIDNFFTYKA
jgi:hypothetical protein